MIRILAALLLLPALTLGQLSLPTAEELQLWAEKRIERFQLYNACRPLQVVVEDLDDDAKKIGLSEQRVHTAVEARLWAARLYTKSYQEADWASLYVNINVVSSAFNINVKYRKRTTDKYGEGGRAMTWSTGGTGTHGRDADDVLSGLSEHVDIFLAAYLRANEDACD